MIANVASPFGVVRGQPGVRRNPLISTFDWKLELVDEQSSTYNSRTGIEILSHFQFRSTSPNSLRRSLAAALKGRIEVMRVHCLDRVELGSGIRVGYRLGLECWSSEVRNPSLVE